MPDPITKLYGSVLVGLRQVKNGFFPDSVDYHRVRFGLCRGYELPLNLRHNMRTVLGLYEPEIISYFKAFSPAGGCLYDIGARHGYYSLAFSKIAGAGRVYAFEPNERDAEECRKVMLRNCPSAKIEVHEIFIGRTVSPEKREDNLDNLVFVRGFDPPDLLKIDVDGPEYEILLGAGRVLSEFRPKLIVEVHSPQLEKDCKALLEVSGYSVKIVKNNPILREHRPIELNRWLAAVPC
jgi:predicted RNA methylase